MKALLLALLASVLPAQASWYLVHVPDVQWYVTDPGWMPHYQHMIGQMLWWQPRPVYVAQVGDFTQTAATVEFERSSSTMRYLDLVGVPWGASIGNHDYSAGLSAIPCDGACTANWTAFLGPTNYYRVVQSAEGPLIFLHLEWNARNSWIAQARSWLDANPTTPTVLVIHSFTERPSGGVPGGYYTTGSIGGGPTPVPGSNNPIGIWHKLLEPYPQVFAVLSGHSYGIVRYAQTTVLGREVQLHCFNLQDDPFGGNGFVRLMQFTGRRIDLWTFSTSYAVGPNRNDHAAVVMPASVTEIASSPQPLHLQCSADTYVFPFWGGGSTRGGSDVLRCSAQGEHLLFNFDVPAGATKAALTLFRDGYLTTGDGCSFHRMLRPWTEQDSWNSLGGLEAGRDYEAVPCATMAPGAGMATIDFTAALPASNGWVALPLGSSPSGWRSREWREPVERPLLSVIR